MPGPVELAARRKHVLAKSGIEYNDMSCNYREGCEHNCGFCYARIIKKIDPKWWHKSCVVKNAPELLLNDIRALKGKIPEDVMLCTSTDPYPPQNNKDGMTRKMLNTLMLHDFPISILTKSHYVVKDADLIGEYDKIRVGVTVFTLNDVVRRAFAPGASPVDKLIAALKFYNDIGVKTWCSLEPILPDIEKSNPFQILQTLDEYVDQWYIGRLNYKATGGYDYKTLTEKLMVYTKSMGIDAYFKKELRVLVEEVDKK